MAPSVTPNRTGIRIHRRCEGVEHLLDGINRLDAMEMAALPVVKDGIILDPDIIPRQRWPTRW